jgi:hypothetical protein
MTAAHSEADASTFVTGIGMPGSTSSASATTRSAMGKLLPNTNGSADDQAPLVLPAATIATPRQHLHKIAGAIEMQVDDVTIL